MEHVRQTTAEGVQADVRAAVERLRPDCEAIFTVGFCFGGRHSWLASSRRSRALQGAIGFYGRPSRRGQDGSPARSSSRTPSARRSSR